MNFLNTLLIKNKFIMALRIVNLLSINNYKNTDLICIDYLLRYIDIFVKL